MSIREVSYEKVSKTYDHRSMDDAIIETLPFPHLVVDRFLNKDLAIQLSNSFPEVDSSWINYIHYNESKYGLSDRSVIPSHILSVIDELNSPKFTTWLSKKFQIPELIPDSELNGGGLHLMKRGGFLNIHTDFNVHPKLHNLRRRLNLILFLNEHWEDKYNGQLELWDANLNSCAKQLYPIFNRCVIFETGEKSYHGSPQTIQCSPDMNRKSIALYYYSYEKAKPVKRFTDYQPTHGTRSSRLMVFLDKKLLHFYSYLKYNTMLNDRWVSKILRIFRK